MTQDLLGFAGQVHGADHGITDVVVDEGDSRIVEVEETLGQHRGRDRDFETLACLEDHIGSEGVGDADVVKSEASPLGREWLEEGK